MAGTLNANQIIPDQGQTLYINGIDYAANVVIGNTNTTIASFTPTGNVTVQGTITANGLISSTGNVNISGVTINSNGNMGIGTSTPAKSLHVASGSYSNSVRIESTGSIQSGVEFVNNSSNTSSPPVVGSKGDAIFFENVNTERMRINAAGNVGIGSTSPSSLLHLKKRLGDAVSGPTATLSFGGNDAYSAAITGYQNNYEDRIGLGFYYYGASGQQLGALLDTSGNLLVGTTSASASDSNSIWLQTGVGKSFFQHATGTTNTTGYCAFTYAGTQIGSITQSTTSAVAFNTTSDQRLKENIVDAPSALDSVNAIKVRSFDWKADGSHVDYGYIAQELIDVAPETVHAPIDSEEMMGVDFGKLTPRLVKAIQELSAELNELKSKVNA